MPDWLGDHRPIPSDLDVLKAMLDRAKIDNTVELAFVDVEFTAGAMTYVSIKACGINFLFDRDNSLIGWQRTESVPRAPTTPETGSQSMKSSEMRTKSARATQEF